MYHLSSLVTTTKAFVNVRHSLCKHVINTTFSSATEGKGHCENLNRNDYHFHKVAGLNTCIPQTQDHFIILLVSK